jgi:hypothetical protein
MDIILGIILKTISIIMLIVFILSIVLLIITFRKPKKVSIPSIAITIVISLITLIVFSSLTQYAPPAWLWLFLVVIGIAIGIFWARTTRVFTKDNQVMSQNSILYLAVWGGIFAINQLITIATNRPPDVTMALLLISTGTVWGTNGAIINKYFKIKAVSQPAANAGRNAAAPTVTPPIPEAKQATSQLPEPARPIPAGFCPTCGSALKEGAAFCMTCGAKL